MSDIKNVVIIGSGPAGYTAAIYAARAMLEPLLITGPLPGGQLMTTTDVENFPGYPNGVQGPQMMVDMQEQAITFGAETLCSLVSEFSQNEDKTFTITLFNGDTILTHSIIVASGASALWLNAEGEEPLRSNGISTCATCDGSFFKGEELLVVGGGDSAMEEATFLTRYASKVTIITRRHEMRASKIMVEKAEKNPKVEWKKGFVVKKWLTNDSGDLRGALLKSTQDNTEEEISCGGAFIAIGHKPNTDFLNGKLETNSEGYIVLKENTMTSISGIFACGDICESSMRYKQAITAAGEGCKAAMDCEKWLEEQNL
jgi:thioredoxin reductase (NADPH)